MLSVVCPVYDEAENIERVLITLRDLVTVPLEVFVVYDRDDDTTIPVVHRIATGCPFPIHLVKNLYGRGALNAIKTGFVTAQSDAVLVSMADLSDDLRLVDAMYDLVAHKGYDIVCGSRYMPGGQQIGGPWLKGALSRCAGLSLHHLLGLPTHDVSNSFKMYRREFVQRQTIESDGGFEIGVELVVKAFISGAKIAELPARWTDRVAGKSRFRLWKWLPKYLRWYFFAFRKLLPAGG